MSTTETSLPHHAVIGNESSFWRYSSQTGFDLTHPPTSTSPLPSSAVCIETTTKPITVDPTKSALVIIDMQNFFLSPALGRTLGPGHAAVDQLVQHAIPAARKAGIQILWLNWGLSETEMLEMPPAITRAFGFETFEGRDFQGSGAAGSVKGTGIKVDKQGAPRDRGEDTALELGKAKRKYIGLGSECGMVEDPATGEQIDAGRLLMRDAWNSALYSPLDEIFHQGTKLDRKPDVWIHKNRMSGMSVGSSCEAFLEKEGIRTLFFTGVNTDQVSSVSSRWTCGVVCC